MVFEILSNIVVYIITVWKKACDSNLLTELQKTDKIICKRNNSPENISSYLKPFF